MKRIVSTLLAGAALFGALPGKAGDLPPREGVVVLHGLGRTFKSMRRLERRLIQEGYLVWNRGYPSTKYDVERLTRLYVAPAVTALRQKGAIKVHFVTHSLGAILVRQYFQPPRPALYGRIVMLSPPNRGSPVIDALEHFRIFSKVLGPAAQQLGAEPKDFVNQLLPISAEIGIIAGSRSYEPWWSLLIPGPDDGKVAVESTKLEEMQDFIEVSCGHTFIMNDRKVLEQTIHFLKSGRFKPEKRNHR